MSRLGRAAVASCVLLALLCVLGTSDALAHSAHAPRAAAPETHEASVDLGPSVSTEAPAATVDLAPPASSAVLPFVLVLVAMLLAGVAIARAPVTTVRVALALVLAITAAETALHSVHHIDDPAGAKDCHVLSVTQQLHGEAAPERPGMAPLVELRSDVTIAAARGTAQAVRRPDQGRAPPLPLA
jgi:hypothetical protein